MSDFISIQQVLRPSQKLSFDLIRVTVTGRQINENVRDTVRAALTLVDSPPGKLQPMPIMATASSPSSILTEGIHRSLIHQIITLVPLIPSRMTSNW